MRHKLTEVPRHRKILHTDIKSRLEAAIAKIYGTHRALAEKTGIPERTISRYIWQENMPAGEAMVKLAQAFPGQIEWILTGRKPTDQEALQYTMSILSVEDQQNVLTFAEILSSHDEALIRFFRESVTLARSVRTPFQPSKRVKPSVEPPRPSGHVYLLKCGPHYKIGKSKTFSRRIRDVGVQLPQKSELIHTIRTSRPHVTETALHDMFAEKRLNGEWFKLTKADVLTIRCIQVTADGSLTTDDLPPFERHAYVPRHSESNGHQPDFFQMMRQHNQPDKNCQPTRRRTPHTSQETRA